jgi:DUF4097 and DUF4098 domain-containing protein YvlB
MKSGKLLIVTGLGVVLLGLCAAILAVFYFTVNGLAQSGLRVRLFDLNNVKAEADEEQSFTVSPPAALDVDNSFGDVTVLGGTGSALVVKAHKTAWGATQADAEAALKDITVVVTQDGNKVTVRVQQPAEVDVLHIGPGQGAVDFTIELPAQADVTAHTDFGALRVTGTHGAADLRSNAGEVHGADLAGGDLKLQSDFGMVSLENSTGRDVSAKSNAGAIALAGVEAEGTVTLDTDFGAVSFEQGRAGALAVQTNNGKVDLFSLTVTGTAQAASDFGSVSFRDVAAGGYDLESNNGSLTVDGARGALRAHTDFGSIDVRNAEDATLDLQSQNGSITFSGTLGAGPHSVKSDFGSIRLALPSTAALEVDLSTDFGKIRSDLPLTLTGAPDEKHWQGRFNAGGARLTAQTNNGDITIEALK